MDLILTLGVSAVFLTAIFASGRNTKPKPKK